MPSKFPWTREEDFIPLPPSTQCAGDSPCLLSFHNELDICEEVTVTSVADVVCDQHTQTEVSVKQQKSTQTQFGLQESRPAYSIDDLKNDPEAVQYNTGLENIDVFYDTLASLGPASNSLTYVNGAKTIGLPVKDQFFLTLIKLRQYTSNFALSRMFKISETDVYNIFVTWVRFMSLQWREIDTWPSQDLVYFYSPTDFKSKFPTTRVLLDGAEFPSKRPAAPAAQQVTFSTYKNRCTAKAIVGATPGGLVSYVSSAYGGSTSDRQIIERSDLAKMCDPGDSIMADKGFDVQDIFAPFDVSVNIPTFFKKKNRMSGKTVIQDRKIASKRVHIERIIGLGKTYKILCNPMNHTESILSSDIIFICYMLVNFRRCIIPKNA